MSMFIELTYCHTGKKGLVNINQITDIDRDKHDHVIVSFGDDYYFRVEENYENIKRKLAMIGKAL